MHATLSKLRNFFFSSSLVTRAIIFACITLIVYGIFCRLVGLYFFWESLTCGFYLIFVSIISIFADMLRREKKNGRSTTGHKAAIAFLSFCLMIAILIAILFRYSEPYPIAVNFIKNNPGLRAEVGNVRSVALNPFGQVVINTQNELIAAQADFHFIVKGSKKYIDLHVHIEKEFMSDWEVKVVE